MYLVFKRFFLGMRIKQDSDSWGIRVLQGSGNRGIRLKQGSGNRGIRIKQGSGNRGIWIKQVSGNLGSSVYLNFLYLFLVTLMPLTDCQNLIISLPSKIF